MIEARSVGAAPGGTGTRGDFAGGKARNFFPGDPSEGYRTERAANGPGTFFREIRQKDTERFGRQMSPELFSGEVRQKYTERHGLQTSPELFFREVRQKDTERYGRKRKATQT